MAAVPADLTRKHSIPIPAAYVGTGGVSDFTVLVTRAMLDDEVCDPSGSNAARSDGGDIRFSSASDGSNMIAIDVIAFEHDSSTGAGDADVLIAVKVPSLSSSVDNAIYPFYHGSTTTAQPTASDTYGQYNAYDASWEAYYPIGSTTDRTSSGATLTAFGSATTGVGLFGSAWSCPTIGDYLKATSPITAHPLTLIAWGKTADATSTNCAVMVTSTNQAANHNDALYWLGATAGDPIAARTEDGGSRTAVTSTGFTANVWAHGAAVFASNSSRTAYINGGSAATNTATRTPSAFDSIFVGTTWADLSDSADFVFAGVLCHIQVHSTARSAAWVATDYNLTNTLAWGTPGTPEAVGGGSNPTCTPVAIYCEPILGKPSVSQTQTVTPTAIYSEPILSTPSIAQTQTVTPTGVYAEPVLGAPAVSQTQSVAPVAIYSEPILGTTTVSQTQTVTPTGIYAEPILSKPAVTQDDGSAPDVVDVIDFESTVLAQIECASTVKAVIEFESEVAAIIEVTTNA